LYEKCPRCLVGAAAVCSVCVLIAYAFEPKIEGAKGLFVFFAVTAGLGTFGCGVIALIRFVKWVWG
jgi:hypothetical protein